MDALRIGNQALLLGCHNELPLNWISRDFEAFLLISISIPPAPPPPLGRVITTGIVGLRSYIKMYKQTHRHQTKYSHKYIY